MGSVYKKTFTKPLPEGAELFTRKGEQLARWHDAKGKIRTAPLTRGQDGLPRVTHTARTFTAKFRDGNGIVRESSTGCRDEQAARAVLADLERRAVRVKVKIVSAAEDSAIDQQATLLADQFDAYTDDQRARGLHPTSMANAKQRLRRIAEDCSWR